MLKPRRRNSNQSHGGEFCYFEFPFINDRTHHAVKRIFRASNLPVRVYSKNRTLRNVLQSKRVSKGCHLRNCPMSNDLCLRKNTVYDMQCQKCQHRYIGSTIRPLHVRVKEHFETPSSSVHKHRSVCGAGFNISILASDPHINRLRFKEAIIIRRDHPSINSKQECEELLHLLFWVSFLSNPFILSPPIFTVFCIL